MRWINKLDSNSSVEENELENFCLSQGLEVTLEGRDGQYWLHSDQEKELPIGIEIDRELRRHEEYFKKNSLQKEILARAIGVKSGVRPKVVDLSAGLLGDTLLMLSFGCEVVALERHPVIAVLIQSALRNATHPALSRLSFFKQDAMTFLEEPFTANTLYFDPMFEDANEKSLPRKEMRIFRNLIGKDQDAEAVLNKALLVNPGRVVVKRPRLSQVLGIEAPLIYEGKATRYDVYLAQSPRPFERNLIK